VLELCNHQVLRKLKIKKYKLKGALFNLFVGLFLCISMANADQDASCLDGVNIPGFKYEDGTIWWELLGTNTAMPSLIFSYPSRMVITHENYTINDGGLVTVKGTNQQGEQFIFFNNNAQYNLHNGKFNGIENGWTLLINQKVYVLIRCIAIGGVDFPRRIVREHE